MSDEYLSPSIAGRLRALEATVAGLERGDRSPRLNYASSLTFGPQTPMQTTWARWRYADSFDVAVTFTVGPSGAVLLLSTMNILDVWGASAGSTVVQHGYKLSGANTTDDLSGNFMQLRGNEPTSTSASSGLRTVPWVAKVLRGLNPGLTTLTMWVQHPAGGTGPSTNGAILAVPL